MFGNDNKKYVFVEIREKAGLMSNLISIISLIIITLNLEKAFIIDSSTKLLIIIIFSIIIWIYKHKTLNFILIATAIYFLYRNNNRIGFNSIDLLALLIAIIGIFYLVLKK